MGATELGWQCCRLLLQMGQNVVGIFSIPEQFQISWSASPLRNVRYRSFADLANTYHIELTYVTEKMSASRYYDVLKRLAPDIIIVVGWYYIIPRKLRGIAPLGVVGIHASLLPKYRGASPLVWAVINGETEAGASLFYLEDGIDTGGVVAQERFSIAPDDAILDVIKKSTQAALKMLHEYVPKLADGTAPHVPQNDADATYVPPRTPEDGYLSWWEKSAVQAYHWVRAQTRPYPGAFTYFNGERLMLWRARPAERTSLLVSGSLTASTHPDAFSVVCSDHDLLDILEVSTHSGDSMSGAEWFRAQAARGIPLVFGEQSHT